MLKAALAVLTAVLTAAYPLLVYFGLAYFRPGIFGLLLLGIVLLRFTSFTSADRQKLLIPVLIAAVYSIAIALSNNETLLRFYPVLINVLMLSVFGWTLRNPPSMIARFAAMRGHEVTQHVKIYVDKVTMAWCGFFVLNGLAAAYTAVFASLKTWAFYNGLLVYIFIALLFALELCTRAVYKKRIAAAAQTRA